MKELRLYIDTPPIKIHRLSKDGNFQTDFDIKRDGFVAKLNIKLDPESIEWDLLGEEDELSPISFNKLIISLVTETDISTANYLENAYFSIIELLDIFLCYIKIELNQYWVEIGSIRDWDLLTLLEKTHAKQFVAGKEENIGIPIPPGKNMKKILFSPKRRHYPDWSNGLDARKTLDIKTWVEEYRPVSLEQQLLADSKKMLLHSDYKASSVLAMTALEGPLETFVKARCKIKKIEKKSKRIAYNLDLFPLTLEPNELTNWLEQWLESTKFWFAGKFSSDQIVDWAKKLNTERNKAVHEGKTPDFDTLDKGVFAVEAIYEFVIDATSN